MTQRTLARVVRWFQAFATGERPEPTPMLVQFAAHADQRRIAALHTAQQQAIHLAADRGHATDKRRAADRAVAIIGRVFEQLACLASQIVPESFGLSLAGDLTTQETSQYICQLDAPSNGLIALNGNANLAGTLSVQVISNVGAVGDSSRTIIEITGEEGAVVGTFAVEPPQGEHLGYGVFHQTTTYNADSVAVGLFQAAAGDADGSREINNTDLQQIPGANSFNNGPGFDWSQGDFDGDTDVDNAELQLILATGLFGTGTYAAGAGPIAVPEPATMLGLISLSAVGLLAYVRRRRRRDWVTDSTVEVE